MSESPPTGPPAQFTEDAMLVADVYASALLETAQDRGQYEDLAAELADFIAYMDREPEFALFMTADTVDDEPRRESLEKLFRGRMNDLLLNLLQVLNNRRRMGILRAVARCVQLRVEARHHQREVTVRSAVPLSDTLREQVRRVVGEYIGREALLIEQLEPELIGGLVLQIGDVQVDASVDSKLRIMLKRLMERATVEIHQGERYVVEA
jgi:F-type H+-transporting ATPase subunit delta